MSVWGSEVGERGGSAMNHNRMRNPQLCEAMRSVLVLGVICRYVT